MNMINRPLDEWESISIISEFARDASATGVARRIDHLEDAFRSSGKQIKLWSLHRTEPPEEYSSRLHRLRASRKTLNGLISQIPQEDAVVVVGLGGAHMLYLAARLSAHRRVLFDTCDSWLLQISARLRSSPLNSLLAVAGALLQLAAPATLEVSYISSRDANVDRLLNGRRNVSVIGPSVPDSLGLLEPSRIPVDRLVILGDFSSFHNREGLRMVIKALKTGALDASIEVDFYGPVPPNRSLPAKARYRGWARSLVDCYRGNTAVIVTNIGGSGIPNKLVESVAARRIVIAHASMLNRIESANLLTFRSSKQLAHLIQDVTSKR